MRLGNSDTSGDDLARSIAARGRPSVRFSEVARGGRTTYIGRHLPAAGHSEYVRVPIRSPKSGRTVIGPILLSCATLPDPAGGMTHKAVVFSASMAGRWGRDFMEFIYEVRKTRCAFPHDCDVTHQRSARR
jgi:hypothetical protein